MSCGYDLQLMLAISREQCWQRAKRDLRAMLAAYKTTWRTPRDGDDHGFEVIRSKIEAFISDIEDHR